jgi:hypothetical protein
MHQIIGNVHWVLTTIYPPQGIVSAEYLIDTAVSLPLQFTVYVLCCTSNSPLKLKEDWLVGWDKILIIPPVTDFLRLQKRRQNLVDQRMIGYDTKRFSPDYCIAEVVLKLGLQPANGSLEQLVLTTSPEFMPIALCPSHWHQYWSNVLYTTDQDLS